MILNVVNFIDPFPTWLHFQELFMSPRLAATSIIDWHEKSQADHTSSTDCMLALYQGSPHLRNSPSEDILVGVFAHDGQSGIAAWAQLVSRHRTLTATYCKNMWVWPHGIVWLGGALNLWPQSTKTMTFHDLSMPFMLQHSQLVGTIQRHQVWTCQVASYSEPCWALLICCTRDGKASDSLAGAMEASLFQLRHVLLWMEQDQTLRIRFIVMSLTCLDVVAQQISCSLNRAK